MIAPPCPDPVAVAVGWDLAPYAVEAAPMDSVPMSVPPGMSIASVGETVVVAVGVRLWYPRFRIGRLCRLVCFASS